MTAPAFTFSTDAYPGEHRESAWGNALALHSLRLQQQNGDLRHFFGQSLSKASPLGLSFSRLRSCAQDIATDEDSGRSDAWVFLVCSGEARIVAGGRAFELATGDIGYGSYAAEALLSFTDAMDVLLVRVPQAALRARLLARMARQAGAIGGHDGVGRILREFLQSVASTLADLDPDSMRPIELAFTELAAAAMAGNADPDALRGDTRIQTSILNRVCQVIEANLGDSDFSSAAAAAKAGISERYMQKILDNAGETFSHYLRLRRLEHSRRELVDPRFAELSITEICYRCGFNDSAHFSRAFREQYNVSPRTYRKMAVTSRRGLSAQPTSRGWPAGVDKELRRAAASRVHEWQHDPAAGGTAHGDTVPEPPAAPHHHHLAANEKTVHWGYLSRSLPPVITVNSGDLVTVETLTHHANDDAERMVRGDAGAESVFHWTRENKAVNRRGAGPMDASVFGRGPGEGFGVQICTGPIAIRGAEPGDVVELRILGIKPRESARYPGRAYGSNAAAWWGFHFKDLLTDPKEREVVTIYEMNCHHCREARALYSFRWTPQLDPSGVLHTTIDYPGVPIDRSTIEERHGILKGVRIPLRPHFGLIGLAPREAEIVDTTPPSYNGGNLDNWRAGAGTTLFLPVAVAGGLLSIGDPHASQGDAELCGTAIECSLTGTFQVVLHKKGDVSPKPVRDLDYPLLETPTEWVIHGFSSANYLAEMGESAQSAIYKQPSLDPAMRDAFWKVRRFLMVNKGLTEDEAISLISVAVDFGITQVVDGNLCVHAIVRKELFDATEPA